MATLFAFNGALSGQELTAVSPAQAEQVLKSYLVPSHDKKHAVVNALVANTDVKVVDLGVSCSSSSHGEITGTVDDDGNVRARTDETGSSNCRHHYNRFYTVKLGLPDVAEPKQSAYLVTVRCAEKWIWDHCQMPAKGTMYPMVLEAAKHGTFYVYAATSEKLGGKMKVAKYEVLELPHYKQKDSQ
jgi:hypothetical protein